MEKFLNGNTNLYRIKDPSKELENHLNELNLRNHLFIASSGTGGERKIYALSKEALLINAKDVNKALQVSQKDKWMCALPSYHIGGLSIEVRAYISQSHVDYYNLKWSPRLFYNLLGEKKTTLLSLVPTQIFDLVSLGLTSPPSLKAVIIGGDYLPTSLADRAIKLGWPIYRTYGMTEFCSQVATSPYSTSSEYIDLLDNIMIKSIDGLMAIKSPKMFTSLTTENINKIETLSASDICQNGFFITKDRGEIIGKKIKILGRADKQVKFKGHYLDLCELERALSNFLVQNSLFNSAIIKSHQNQRTGIEIVILVEGKAVAFKEKIKAYLENKFTILKGEVKLELVNSIIKTELGKIKSQQ